MRQFPFSRSLMRESSLQAHDLIQAAFMIDEDDALEQIPSLPGICRLGLNQLLQTAEACLELQIPALVLFPVVSENEKTEGAEAAYDPDGLVPSRVYEIKKRFPELGIITDVALDPYTSHGQDGLINEKGYVLNDQTIDVLVKQALSHAAAGADIVAPSDMMDGRIGMIRKGLDQSHFSSTMILAYTLKYASAFYAPFRDAVGSAKALGKADKLSYQMDPANSDEALHEAALDIQEGADMIMIKPGLPYLDVLARLKETFKVPTLAYQVSGEYSMLKAAADRGWIDEKRCVLETLQCFKRAGADAIVSYYAMEAARWLR